MCVEAGRASSAMSCSKVLVHGYFAIDLDEVWGIAQRQLPTLRAQIESILRELGQTGPGVAEHIHPYALTI